MDIVAKLREEAFSEHAAYTEFILKLKKDREILFCFFEGKNDYKYYGIRIQNIGQREFKYVDCHGKDNVISVKRLIDQQHEYQSLSIAYFVDRDFNDKIAVEGIYCLPSYSIENQYANKETLLKILESEFSISEENIDFKAVESLFEQLQREFHNKVRLLNIWLACQSDKRSQSKSTHLKIDDSIGHYFNNIVKEKLTLRDLSDLNDLAIIESIFFEAQKITPEEIDEKSVLLQASDAEYTFRGKFELAFFISFLDRLKSEICKKKSSIFEKRHKCNLRFEFVTALTTLSIYARTPSCLVEYINSKRKDVA